MKRVTQSNHFEFPLEALVPKPQERSARPFRALFNEKNNAEQQTDVFLLTYPSRQIPAHKAFPPATAGYSLANHLDTPFEKKRMTPTTQEAR